MTAGCPTCPTAGTEASIVATLLTEYPDSLPPNLARLLRHAPESFDDQRIGIIRDREAG